MHWLDALPAEATLVPMKGETTMATQEQSNPEMAAAYRAQTTLLNLPRPHYPRAENEGRAFLRSAVRQTGDLQVDDDEVVVQLAPMSDPRYTAASRALCEEFYRLRYEVRAEPETRCKSCI
jgi:hypothetical protein